MLNSKDLINILNLLGRVTLEAKEAESFVGLVQRTRAALTYISALEKKTAEVNAAQGETTAEDEELVKVKGEKLDK